MFEKIAPTTELTPAKAINYFNIHSYQCLPPNVRLEGRSPTYRLCYQIVHSSPDSSIDLKQYSVEQLNGALTYRNLRAIHLAALVGNTVLVQGLVEHGAENLPDTNNWCAVHFAATCRREELFIWLLTQFGDNKTRQGFTAQEIRFWLQPPVAATPQPALWERTNALFIDRCYAQPVTIANRWVGQNAEKPGQQTAEKWYSHKTTALEICDEVIPEVGLGVRTPVPLREGQLVAHYHGIMGAKTDARFGTRYLLAEIDAGPMRGVAGHINHGFPNVAYVSHPVSGLDCSYIEALSRISVGGRLYTDYGDCYESLRTKPCCELNAEALVSYFKEHRVAFIPDESQRWFMMERSAYSYLGHTPTAVLTLLKERVATAADLRELFNDKGPLNAVATNRNHHRFMQRWIDALDGLSSVGLSQVTSAVQSHSAMAVEALFRWRKTVGQAAADWQQHLSTVQTATLTAIYSQPGNDDHFRLTCMLNGTEPIDALLPLCEKINAEK